MSSIFTDIRDQKLWTFVRFIFFLLFIIRSGETIAESHRMHDECCDSLFSFHSQKGYFPMLWTNMKKQAVSPLHTSGSQWMKVGGAALITTGLIVYDRRIDWNVRDLKDKSQFINKFSTNFTELGGSYSLYLMGGLGAYALLNKDNYALQTTLLATQAMITSGIWARVFKAIAKRERPIHTYDFPVSQPERWYGPFYPSYKKSDMSSSYFDAFPSGHAATAFSIATVFTMQYSDKIAIPIISYSAATLIGFTRMTEHTHWASDVFAGACLGYVCGRQVVNNYRRVHNIHSTNSDKKKLGYYVVPTQNGFTGFIELSF